jgi:hypothetical protein
MDQTSFAHFSLSKKNTGSVFSGAEGISMFNVFSSDLSVTDLQIACDTVDIIVGQEQR